MHVVESSLVPRLTRENVFYGVSSFVRVRRGLNQLDSLDAPLVWNVGIALILFDMIPDFVCIAAVREIAIPIVVLDSEPDTYGGELRKSDDRLVLAHNDTIGPIVLVNRRGKYGWGQKTPFPPPLTSFPS